MPYGQPASDYEKFEGFIKNHIDQFGRFAYRTVKNYDYAQEGVQNAVLAVLKYYDRVREFDEQRLYRYCLSIIKHECIRAATENHRLISLEEYDNLEPVPDEMLDQIIVGEDTATLAKCVGTLPENFKLAILMKYYYNQSDKEIAQTIGVNDHSVRMILTRARQKLKKAYLQATGEEETV